MIKQTASLKIYHVYYGLEGKSVVVETVQDEQGENCGGHLITGFSPKSATRVQRDTLQSFLLALACEGMDVGSKMVSAALQSTLESLANNT